MDFVSPEACKINQGVIRSQIDLLARGLVTSKGIVTHGFAPEKWEEAIEVDNSLDSIKVLMRPR